MRPFPLAHALMFRKYSAPFYFCQQHSHFRSACSALCAVFRLYLVQENVWYLYQPCSRRSKQQRAEDNTSPGRNNLQGNGPSPAGSCFNTLKTEEVPHVKNRKCGPVRVSFSAHRPNSSLSTSCPGAALQPSHFLYLKTQQQQQRPRGPDLDETPAGFPRFQQNSISHTCQNWTI